MAELPKTATEAPEKRPESWVYMVRCADGSLYTGWTEDRDFAFAHREELCSPFGKRVHDPSAPYDAYDESDDTEDGAKSGYLKGVGR